MRRSVRARPECWWFHAGLLLQVNNEAENPLELFQIWINLPRQDKMADPYFKMLWADEIPTLKFCDDNVSLPVHVTFSSSDMSSLFLDSTARRRMYLVLLAMFCHRIHLNTCLPEFFLCMLKLNMLGFLLVDTDRNS